MSNFQFLAPEFKTLLEPAKGAEQLVCGFHGHPATHSMSIWPPIPR